MNFKYKVGDYIVYNTLYGFICKLENNSNYYVRWENQKVSFILKHL